MASWPAKSIHVIGQSVDLCGKVGTVMLQR